MIDAVGSDLDPFPRQFPKLLPIHQRKTRKPPSLAGPFIRSTTIAAYDENRCRKPVLPKHRPGMTYEVAISVVECHRNRARDLADAGERNHSNTARSEERRVGKECRSRWSPYQ